MVVFGLLARGTLASRLPRGDLNVLSSQALSFDSLALPPTPAFFVWYLAVEGIHSPSRTFRVRAVLKARIELAPEVARGRYQVRARWELCDFFGLTRWTTSWAWTTTWTVPVIPVAFLPPRVSENTKGLVRPRQKGRRPGDPFDVRRYTPGDDLRRLHWTLYAHTGTPFVRSPSPTPPPWGQPAFVLDTEADNERDLDLRLGALVSWLSELESKGSSWTLSVPSALLMLRAGEDFGRLLAPLVPGPPSANWQPSSLPSQIILVTGPGSSTAKRLAAEVWSAKKSVLPVTIPKSPPPIPELRPWWRRPS